MTTRFRTTRCAHGLAIGLCPDRACKAPAAEPVPGLLVPKLKQLKCNYCKRSGADVKRLGVFHGATASHPGYQSAWHPGCWEDHLARKAVVDARIARGHVPRMRSAAEKARALGQDANSGESEQ